jgi:hypothetical protein
MASTAETRKVLADLTYWSHIAGNSVVVDFTTPGAEQRFAELDKFNVTCTVPIHDIRNLEGKYTLQRNGFQYVYHEMPELDGSTMSEKEIEDYLIPATQKLVEELYVHANSF